MVFVAFCEYKVSRNVNAPFIYKIIGSILVGAAVSIGALILGLAAIAGRVLLQKYVGVLGEHRLTITEENLIESTTYNESAFRWSGYQRTVVTKAYLLLYVTDTMVYFIPRKRPLLEGDLPRFEAALAERTKRS